MHANRYLYVEDYHLICFPRFASFSEIKTTGKVTVLAKGILNLINCLSFRF